MAKLLDGTRIYGNATVDGNITVGNILSNGFYWANGVPFSTGSGGSADKISSSASNVTVTTNYVNVAINSSNVLSINSANVTATGNVVANKLITTLNGPTPPGAIYDLVGGYIHAQAALNLGTGGDATISWGDGNFPSTIKGNPNEVYLYINNNTTDKQAWRAFSNGQLLIGNGETDTTAARLTVNGNARITNTSISTSTTTGALVVAGGLGVGGNVFAGNVHADGFFWSNGVPYSTGSGSGSPDKISSGGSNVTVTTDYVNVAINSSNVFSVGSSGVKTEGVLTTTSWAQVGTGLTGDVLYIGPGKASLGFTGSDVYFTTSGATPSDNLVLAVNGNQTTTGLRISGTNGNVTVQSNLNSTSSTTGALVVAGGVGIAGNLRANAVYTDNLFYANGVAFSTGSSGSPDKISSGGSNVTVTTDYVNVAINSSNVASFDSQGLIVGQPLNYTPLNANLRYAGSANTYVQFVVQNKGTGTLSTSDLVAVADNGNDNDTFISVGITSSTYNDPTYDLSKANDGYIYVTGNAVTGGGNLTISTYSNKDIIFSTGGGDLVHEQMRIKHEQGVHFSNGNITTSSTLGNIFVSGVTTGNIFAAATTWTMGETTGTANIRNANIYFPNATTIFSGQTGVSLFNTVATAINMGGATTQLTLGATTGVANIRNANIYFPNATTIFSGQATVDVMSTATTLSLGATTGTANIRNANIYFPNATTIFSGQTGVSLFNTVATAINMGGATTQLTLGATTGTANIRNANIYFPNATTIFSGQTTLTLANTVTTTMNIGGATTVLTLGGANGNVFALNNVTVDGNIFVTTGNVHAGNVLTNNYLYANGVSALGGFSSLTADRIKSISIQEPTSAESVTLFHTSNSAITLNRVIGVVRGTTNPGVYYRIQSGASRDGTSVVPTTLVGNTWANSLTNGNVATITSASISANVFVWLETFSTSGTVNEFSLTLVI